MNFEFHAQTHPGRARENNEDAIVFDVTQQIAVLADGMGGYNAGEVASAMATELVLDSLTTWKSQAGPAPDPAQVRNAIEDAVDKVNRVIFDAANQNPDYSGMGTTLVVAVLLPQSVVIGHLGDSRCYRMRGGTLALLTRDHSLLQEQLDAGLITPRQAAQSGNRNLVTRALGVEDAVLLEVHDFEAEPGDLYLICSDGLNDMVGDEEIAEILTGAAPLARKADALVNAANEYGGRDNVSVLLAQASGGNPPRRGLVARFLGP
ncbi:MAG: Stp1/IreP family PP2C-type Ser/Thr phosphatase [Burkholderiales bacterium]